MTTEQQINLKFPVRLGKSASEALYMLQQVYKEQTSFQWTVFLWHKSFKGRENVEDDPRCGRPSTSKNETNDKIAKKMVRGNRRLTERLISDEIRLN